MTKPVYKYPAFVQEVTLLNDKEKRYWLNLTIDTAEKENIIVILKNPSRANKEISDKTVYNVSNYIYRNQNRYQELKNIGNITILNLIPYYQTYSEKLIELKEAIIDPENLKTINNFTKKNNKVIIAWGNHPSGLFHEYESLKLSVMDILKTNQSKIYFIEKFSQAGNPKHGQIWGYSDAFVQFNK